MLNFNDGVSIDTSGELRVLRLSDGLYVVGNGMCVPVESRAEAAAVMEEEVQSMLAST
jgi:hypothetical protein